MILVDTSVWIAHLRAGHPRLMALLHEESVLTHPFVVGELACGSIGNRDEILGLLKALPKGRVAEPYEVTTFVEDRRLYGHGIGWLDAHLLASALLSDSRLWTLDSRLSRVASTLNISA